MKKKMSVFILTCMSILFTACLVFLYLIVGTDIFFKNTSSQKYTPVYDDSTTADLYVDYSSGELSVNYNGGIIFAGGRVTSDSFVVEYKDEKGNIREITDYECNMLRDSYRLGIGSNTFVFNYNGLTAMITLEAVEAESMGAYAPSYILYNGDKELAESRVSQIEAGNLTYRDALSDVAFTGDSQIYTLISYNILGLDTVEALVGASADYLAENMETVITKAYGKKALIVHYGINSLSSSVDERAYRISQYRELLVTLKESLPGTRIVVSGVFPVSSVIQYDKASFAYINTYDYALLNMCMDIDVEYYSNNEYIDSHQEYFSPDGLHLQYAFYNEYWLKDLILTLGI